LGKNILIFRNRKSVYIHRIPFHSEGRFANVTDVGMGCGGRRGARDGRACCGRRGRVVLTASVSVREEVESYESFVIQERWPDSEGPPMWTNENRARYDRSHLRYPSDLTDDEWKLVEPLIPPGRRGGDKRTVIMREVVNGLMYILSTGCQWRAIPKDLPPRSTLYDYFDLWSWDRTLDLIHHELYVKCREAIGREASPTAAVIDSQSVKSAEKGGLRLIRRATTRERRSKARSGTFSSIRKAC